MSDHHKPVHHAPEHRAGDLHEKPEIREADAATRRAAAAPPNSGAPGQGAPEPTDPKPEKTPVQLRQEKAARAKENLENSLQGKSREENEADRRVAAAKGGSKGLGSFGSFGSIQGASSAATGFATSVIAQSSKFVESRLDSVDADEVIDPGKSAGDGVKNLFQTMKRGFKRGEGMTTQVVDKRHTSEEVAKRDEAAAAAAKKAEAQKKQDAMPDSKPTFGQHAADAASGPVFPAKSDRVAPSPESPKLSAVAAIARTGKDNLFLPKEEHRSPGQRRSTGPER